MIQHSLLRLEKGELERRRFELLQQYARKNGVLMDVGPAPSGLSPRNSKKRQPGQDIEDSKAIIIIDSHYMHIYESSRAFELLNQPFL